MKNLSYESVIKEIKRRLSIVSLIEAYLSLKRSGKNFVGICPFHDDKNPSLHVSEEKGLFHCFSCGAGGDIFGFMMRYNNISFPEAIAELAKRADVPLERQYRAPAREKSRANALFRINSLICKFYHKALLESQEGKEALNYLSARGISLETVKEFNLGYAPSSWDTLTRILDAKNIPLSMAEEIGLVIKRQNKDGYYDRFRGRIIFPIKDVDGKVVGFGGRTVSGEEPKYMKSEIYHKKSILYGLDRSRDYIRREKHAVVVEGYMDFLSLFRAGIRNAVATLGTSLTREHAIILRRYTDKVIVVFDGDEAGKKAALRVLVVFLPEGLKPLMVILPEGHDPASFIFEGRQDEFQKLLHSAAPILDFMIERNMRSFEEQKTSRSAAVKEIADVLSKMKDTIERSYYIKKTGESFGVREDELLSLLKFGDKLEGRISAKKPVNNDERLVLKTLLKFPKLVDYICEDDLIDIFPENEIKTVLEHIILNGFDDLSSLLFKFNDSSVQEAISEVVFLSDDVPDEATAWKLLKDCIRKLKLKRVEENLRVVRIKIDRAIAEKNNLLEEKLIKEYRDLIQEQKNIRGRD